MIALQQATDEELALRKDSFERLHITCTFQPEILYAGLTVDVLAPEYDIVEGVSGAVGIVLKVFVILLSLVLLWVVVMMLLLLWSL